MIFDRIQQSAIVQLIKKYAFPPDQSVTTAKLGYNMREAILDRTVSRVLYTDGTSAGTWHFATGAAGGFYEGSYQLLPDMIALVTDVDTTRGVAHLRAAPGSNTGTGGVGLILVRDGPKIFRANVKYDGTANAGTWAFVGFNYQHTTANQHMVCFTCNGTSNWFATIMEEFVLISSVDTGVPASDWADLQIRITETGAAFELIVTDEWGNTSVDTTLYTHLWVDAALDSVLLTNVGACIRKRAAGSVQQLYIKQMFLQDNRAEGTYSKLGHTHLLDEITDFKETKIYIETDCNAAGEFSTYSLSGGSNVFTTAGLTHCNGHWGILRCGTAASASSVAGIGAGTITDSVIFGTYKHETTAIVYIPNLSNATNRFYVEHGFSDNRGGVPTDAVMFSYIDTQMGGNWACLAYNNTVLTAKDSGVPVAALTWYKLRVVVNVNGSSEFYINGTQVATTTDFPVGSVGTGSARATANGCTIRKTVGVAARNLDIDYYNLQIGTSR
jgi:hypothetical protein